MAPKFALAFLIAFSMMGGLIQDKSVAQTPAGQQQPPPPQTSPKTAMPFGLAEDTPVRLRLNRNLSSATEKVNDKVDFEVVEDVKVGDVVVIPHGATAIATVIEAQPKRRMGRSGKLNINIDSVQLASGEKVALRAVKGGNGGSHTGAMTGAMVATGILFFPAAPLFLLMHGKDINIPKGTEVTAYIAADIPLDKSKFIATTSGTGREPATATAQQPPQAQGSPAATDPTASAVVIMSDPGGADISIDGKYVGATQSKVMLLPGEHTIAIEKSGYKKWSRVMTVSAGGSLTVDAALEKLP